MADGRDESKNEPTNDSTTDSISRRTFLGALGAAAVAGAFLERGGDVAAQEETYWYYNSWGNVVAVDPAVIAAGVYPPPLPEGVTAPVPGAPEAPDTSCGSTYVTGGFKQPNILLLMVDQLRFPRWLTQSQQSTFATSIMPNVFGSAGLISKSVSFRNFFVAANDCTPSRSAFLTGLYPQQTMMFLTQNKLTAPSLQPYDGGSGFPTIGDVLSQSLNINCGGPTMSPNYDTAWIGKWHVSDDLFASGTGYGGPDAYGFSSKYCIPTPYGGLSDNPYPNSQVGYPSPNGTQNEGAGGDSLGSNSVSPWVYPFTYNTQATPADPIDVNDRGLNIYAPSASGEYLLSDAGIYHAFHEHWLPAHPNTSSTPWFLGLSFINPHDIQYFPWAFGLATNADGQTCGSGNDFSCNPPTASNSGYYPAPVLGWQDNYDSTELINFAVLPYTLYNSANTPPNDWNNADDPQSQPYNALGIPGGKPGLQGYFEWNVGNFAGQINTTEGWYTFLNYYYWMQSFVDTLIGNVLQHINSEFSPASTHPTAIIFTSDHGDYGGSHNLHTKGGGLYDEAYGVPLLYQSPGQTSPFATNFLCSSVDVLPFIYSMAIGNESWRDAPSDMVNYLQGRESLFDVIYNERAVIPRRVAYVPNAFGGPQEMQYVLFSTDEYNVANQWNETSIQEPSHAVAFRTMDPYHRIWGSDNTMNFFGGGKLGMYTYWLPKSTYPNTGAGLTQFEFYDYYVPNYREIGNDAFQSGNWNTTTAGAYLTAYNNIMAAELYNIYPQIAVAHNTAFNAYMNYQGVTGYSFETWPPNNITPP